MENLHAQTTILLKPKLTRLMHRLLKRLSPDTVFVSKQVRALAKLTL